MDSKTVIKKFENNIEKEKYYTLTAQMDIVSNEEMYNYNVSVEYLKPDYYKVVLTNSQSNHEQIILKNKNGTYVVTPSLNKSFKFQSDWPYNTSQVYILSSLLKDLLDDDNVLYEKKDNNYILSSTVNYPNNTNLLSQKIIFNEDFLPDKVIVYDKEGNECITLKISKIDFKTKIDEKTFEIDSISLSGESEVSKSIDEIVYPMYLPIGTKFKSEETIKTDESERVILTFSGDKSFILIEEASLVPNELKVTSTSGELVFYENILGTLNESSLNWTMNGKDYYLIGNNMSNDELLKVASSMSVVAISK